MEVIYLDNNATTMPAPEVLAAMSEALLLGNPASQHAAGRRADGAVEAARALVAGATGCRPGQVTFTSGSTESINLAILGAWRHHVRQGQARSRFRIAVGATEHPAVLEAAHELTREGAEVVELPVLADGRIDVDAARALIDGRVFMVSVMAANNETGVINPVADIATIAHRRGAHVHTDATQAMGRIVVDMTAWDVDLMSISGHKFHGPRGVGALLHTRAVPLEPLMYGGGQERGLRPGTHNAPGIVGLGAAAAFVPNLLASAEGIARLRDLLFELLCDGLPNVSRNGSADCVLGNTLNVRFAGADNEAVLSGLRTVMCSTGSACASGKPEPSHVLTAMGLSKAEAEESIRFSLSNATTEEDVRSAAAEVVDSVQYVVQALRQEVS